MESTQKNIISNFLTQNLDLRKDDIQLIKNALENYYFDFDGNNQFQESIGKVEIKINKIMEAF